jgi:hypothetical protein
VTRERARALAVAAATALGVIAVAISLFQDDDEPGRPVTSAPVTVTAPTTVTAPGSTAPAGPVAPPEPDVTGWGDFPGAPPDLTAPPGGTEEVTVDAGAPVLAVRRADGTLMATASLDASGAPLDARFFDRTGDLTLVVAGLRAAAAGSGAAGARVRCGSSASARDDFRWTRFPIRWRFGTARTPPGISRAQALLATRRARGTWNANRSHCRGIPDASRARFTYVGASGRATGRDGVNLVEFGDPGGLGGVCSGTVACALTWISGGRAIESDIRIRRVRPNGYFTASGRRRGIDLQSVMVHESGHTLGFDHVSARTVAMFPVIAERTVGGRILGRGDALANNRTY